MSPPAPRHQRHIVTDRPNDFRSAWARLLNYMDRYKWAILIAAVFSAVSSCLSVIGPDKLSDMTDVITAGIFSGTMDMDAVTSIGIQLTVIFGMSVILGVAQGLIIATVSQSTAGRLRDDVSDKINRIPMRYFDSASTGDLMSRVTNDTDTIGRAMNQSVGIFISSVTLFIGSLIMMAWTNMIMMLSAVLSTFVGFILMMLIMKKSQKYFDAQQRELGQMNGHVDEIYSAHTIVKAYSGEKKATETFDGINQRLFVSAYRSQFLSGLMMPLMNFIGNFGYVVVCIVGAALVIHGQATMGTIVAFMIYIRLFTQPLSQISQALSNMQSVAAGAERVFQFLDEEEMADESGLAGKIGRSEGHVEFRDVHFGYVPGKEVIHGFSANVLPGQKIAIVGPTGAGKTTMVNLLMKFYEVDSGDILIDGVSLKDLKREEVHEQFCMVLQDTWLFNGTIRENVIYNREGISDERVAEACRAVGIHHYISTLPDGYNTVLGDSTSLSAGQRQQLTIARAMIDDSPMLILDEATSSVDTRTEKIIQDVMDRFVKGRTSFVIAHRLSTIRNADLILVMRNGSIIEQGTHDGLLARGGFYKELYDSQFEETEME